MQSAAGESGGTVTAFLVPDVNGEADWQVRWFGRQTEVLLCGHATMASAHILLARGAKDSITFRSQQGAILEARACDMGIEMALSAIEARLGDWPEAAKFLGAEPVVTYRSDLRYAAFFFESEAQIRALAPDFSGLASLGDDQFICTAPGDRSDIVSRVFTPGLGLGEDIVTGSAHAVLTPLWTKRLERDQFSAVQASERGGRMECRLEGDQVVLAGECATVIEGEFYLSG